jgi:hypothetical protein
VEGQRRTVVWYGESDAHGTSSAKRLTIPAAAAVALLLSQDSHGPVTPNVSHCPPSFSCWALQHRR